MSEGENAPEPVQPVGTPRADLDHARLVPPDDKPVTFILDKGALLGGINTQTCPQCGLNPAGPPRPRKLQFIPPWVYIGLLFNVIILLVLIAVGRKTVATHITLCDDCTKAEKRARMIRGLSIAGGLLAPLGILIGGLAAGFDEVGLIGGAIGLVGGLVGMVVAHRRTRGDVIMTKKIDKTQVTLIASPSFPEVIRKEAPRLLVGANPSRVARIS